MTQITDDHVEWAVVDRLRRMLDEPPHEKYNVTQTYALFITIICWVMQHVRIPPNEINTPGDLSAHKLLEALSQAAIGDHPWGINVAPVARIERIGSYTVKVPAPEKFESHTVRQFLINLRDATAHGDARKVSPFNVRIGAERVLVGFSFKCTEIDGRKRITWQGKITLLEADMRRSETNSPSLIVTLFAEASSIAEIITSELMRLRSKKLPRKLYRISGNGVHFAVPHWLKPRVQAVNGLR